MLTPHDRSKTFRTGALGRTLRYAVLVITYPLYLVSALLLLLATSVMFLVSCVLAVTE